MSRRLSLTSLAPWTTGAAITALVAGCSGGSSGAALTPSATLPEQPSSAATAPSPTAPPQSAVPAESNPPGDIPDNLAFVTYRNSALVIKHPEGWAETARSTSVLFTDKLNGVQAQVAQRTSAPTVRSAQQSDIPALRRSQPAFEIRSVKAVTLAGGTGVRIVYRRNSAADPVTGRQYRDEVERYELFRGGHAVDVELFGPVGADNVDAYGTMISSLQIR